MQCVLVCRQPAINKLAIQLLKDKTEQELLLPPPQPRKFCKIPAAGQPAPEFPPAGAGCDPQQVTAMKKRRTAEGVMIYRVYNIY